MVAFNLSNKGKLKRISVLLPSVCYSAYIKMSAENAGKDDEKKQEETIMENMMEMKELDMNELEKITGAGMRSIPNSAKCMIQAWVYQAKNLKNLSKEESYAFTKGGLDKMAKNLFDEDVLRDYFEDVWNSLE